MSIFSEKIKDLRKEKNLTQKELAKALSITISTLSHWECDYQEPSFKDLTLLANFFEVSVDYLLGITDYEEKVQINAPRSPALKPDEKELLNLYRQLSYEGKHRLIARAEVMLEDADKQNKQNKYRA